MSDTEQTPARKVSKQSYPWTRFWCAREKTYALDESGFLSDPDAFLGESLKPNARLLESWDEDACVVLLGEAGIGKSREVRRWHERGSERSAAAGASRPFFFDLADPEFPALFKQRVLQAAWRAEWQADTSLLDLTLDGLDEALSGPRATGKHLVGRLRELPIERVRVRITCRTAAWLEWLGNEFAELWHTAPPVLELLPLRRRDIVVAAEMYPVDAHAFLQEVMQRGVQSLAWQPLTLDFLLALFAQGRLPSTRAEVYQKGLLKLADETPSRRTGPGPGRLSAAQRCAVAERIAACSLLAGAGSLSIGDDALIDGSLHESAILGGIEGAGSDAVQVDRPAFRETLDTGLFSGRGAERLGFAHHSYAEFLAASWLARHDLSRTQIYDLIGTPHTTPIKVAPQWHAVAAWLAGLRTDILDGLLRDEPEVLIDAEVGTALRGREAELVEAYLRRVDSGAVPYPTLFGRQPFFRGLDSRAAESALRACVNDSALRTSTRRLGITVARDVKCLEVLDDLVQLALDPQAPVELRADAAFTVSRVGDARARGQLKPLTVRRTSEDESDELLGAALLCCWPEHMTCTELLAALRPRRNHSFFGVYWRFLASEDTVVGISDADLPRVLEWLAQQRAHAMSDDFKTLRECVIHEPLRGWATRRSPTHWPNSPFSACESTRRCGNDAPGPSTNRDLIRSPIPNGDTS